MECGREGEGGLRGFANNGGRGCVVLGVHTGRYKEKDVCFRCLLASRKHLGCIPNRI